MRLGIEVTLQSNFTGLAPLAPLPFACRTLQDAAKEDVEPLQSEVAKKEAGSQLEATGSDPLPKFRDFGHFWGRPF